MFTVLTAAGLAVYQFLVLEIKRPPGFNSNSLIFAIVVLMWSLFILSNALNNARIKPFVFVVAL